VNSASLYPVAFWQGGVGGSAHPHSLLAVGELLENIVDNFSSKNAQFVAKKHFAENLGAKWKF